ncbi:HET-domain-containing protein [Xylariaceae sp. FL1019]|nr:HET-domain-containing protein [Xylariaceae sp. FL1019]
MRLLHTATLELETFNTTVKPGAYAIVSHTWGEDEVVFEDVQTRPINEWRKKAGAAKILEAAKIAAKSKISFIWIDTCCIDKSSSSELSESINSMYQWYMNSHICYVYLSDVLLKESDLPRTGIVPFKESRWFRRGWTGKLKLHIPRDHPYTCFLVSSFRPLILLQLQELIAPSHELFFDKSWSQMGTRNELANEIHLVTTIDTEILAHRNRYYDRWKRTVHTRMVWASRRETTRAEDMAYSLMGIFDVNMPLLYGEGGQRAFERLQVEIIKRTKRSVYPSAHSVPRSRGFGQFTS